MSLFPPLCSGCIYSGHPHNEDCPNAAHNKYPVGESAELLAARATIAKQKADFDQIAADHRRDADRDAARIAELEAAQRWIPVEEKNPEGYGYDYLVCYGGIIVEQARFDGGHWNLARTDSYDNAIEVWPSHWRPLPAPPAPSPAEP